MHTKAYAPIVLRLGLAAVFLWFGINQLVQPAMFLGYVPHHAWMQMMHMTPSVIVPFNGIAEIILGALLALGMGVRVVAILLALHLAIIAANLGYNDVAIRDLGLAAATVAIALHGPDKWCIRKR